jgi:MOSC domain-containing protein YiiM
MTATRGAGIGTGWVVGLQRSDGGVPKTAVDRAVVGVNGMEGDRQRHLKFHGGPTRALCLYSGERIAALAAEGHPIVAGSVGENVTIEGLPWELVRPGTTLEIGEEVEVEVTSYTAPCRNIAGAFADGRFARIGQKANPGWSRVYVAVRRGGTIACGDAVRLFEGIESIAIDS